MLEMLTLLPDSTVQQHKAIVRSGLFFCLEIQVRVRKRWNHRNEKGVAVEGDYETEFGLRWRPVRLRVGMR
jgi:hypothetical protein